MEIKTLKGTDTKEILHAFNSSFTDYFIPLQFTLEQMESKMIKDNVDLDLSIGVFKENTLLAFILNGVDQLNGKKVIYNSGTGVIPSERSKGLTQKMYDFILPILKENSFDYSVLEVISENQAALKSYGNSGFLPFRELLCYFGKPTNFEQNSEVEIKKLENFDWDMMETFWDIHPSWQNSQMALNRIKNSIYSLGAYIKNEMVGYAIFHPENKRILQIAVSKQFRNKGIGSSLVQQLITCYGSTISAINVDKNGECINGFFRKIGLESDICQIEMKLDLQA